MNRSYLFILFSLLITLVYAAAIEEEEEPVGSPGVLPAPDQYNSFINWNRTYAPTEPQQIHISLGNDAKYAKIQFATTAPIKGGILKYWPKKHAKKPVVIKQSDDWTFVDGGIAKRPLYLHNIQTKRLKFDTIYQYQVGAINESGTTSWSPSFEFHTAPRRDSFKFLATGDMGLNNAVTMKTLVGKAATHEYAFITVSGDQAYDMADFNGTKGDEYMNFAQQLFATVPYLGVTGNHEGAYNFSHYKNRFNIVPYQESGSSNSLFYSIDYKSLHLISFSTEVYLKQGTPEQRQYSLNWLEQDLIKANKNRHQRPWIILITHHPLYCSIYDDKDCTTDAVLIREGPLGPDNITRSGGLESLLLKYKVDLYLAGHVHNYERTYPLANNTRLTTSYVNPPSFFHVINGNAGQPEGPSAFPVDDRHEDWSAVRYGSYGFSEFTVSHDTLELTHHKVNIDGTEGEIIDYVKVVKTQR